IMRLYSNCVNILDSGYGYNPSETYAPVMHRQEYNVGQSIDPEAFMNATQLIESKGFPCETHHPITEDGYVLGMQRMPQPSKTREPVFLLHGLLSSSDCFLTNLVNESLAYILYNAGYDVWLGNVRGNRYSRKHVTMSPDDLEFWDWSFDQMGQYDVPAMINHILNVTGHPRVHYIGHSQGTTSLFTGVMRNGRSLADKVKSFIALAPAALVPNMQSPLHYLMYLANDIDLVYNLFGQGDFLPHDGLLETVSKLLCPYEQKICQNLFFLIGGTDFTNTNVSRIPVYSAHDPSGTSTQNMLHWAQMFGNKEDTMKYYDYGYIKNFKRYGQVHPPRYNFSDFTVPTYAFCGYSDTLVVLQDCKKLMTLLPNVREATFIPHYTHLDFIFAMNSPQVLYSRVLKIL
uniref:Lipase n=1 Tax=Ciona intestinalis TaxID=7719 RepID=H2XR44_CIOIN